ncbi:hypothetical protein STSP2_00749 [Anaerohalosphaera lusitana]|uniref:Uncharacterized protein n=1 Tax=Anaerohalosphaera lusitana TaxID=1936003 RepID=A0A1U9NI53_9BACT|nr:hypothetical protein STSP2_00749 [Anaerohalosphaera lusitana]
MPTLFKPICVTIICSFVGALISYAIIVFGDLYYGMASREVFIGIGGVVLSIAGIHAYSLIGRHKPKPLMLALVPIITFVCVMISSLAYGFLCYLVASITPINDIFWGLMVYIAFYAPSNVFVLYYLLIHRHTMPLPEK